MERRWRKDGGRFMGVGVIEGGMWREMWRKRWRSVEGKFFGFGVRLFKKSTILTIKEGR